MLASPAGCSEKHRKSLKQALLSFSPRVHSEQKLGEGKVWPGLQPLEGLGASAFVLPWRHLEACRILAHRR